jgi:uncharacterized protein (TIGR04141 family)
VATEFSSLSIYRLRDELDDFPIKKLSDFIDSRKKPSIHNLKRRYDFGAQLFVAPPEKRSPGWIGPLEIGFGGLDEIPDSVRTNAVLILSVKQRTQELHFAVTFGSGRFLLRSDSLKRNYGLRVALNAIYSKHEKGQKLDFERLRSVDSKTVADTTLRTRRQADRRSDFESFSIDTERDFLSGITGTPLDPKLWGKRIDGSDSVRLHRPVTFEQLGNICLQLEHNSKKIPRDFSWVDNIFPVRVPAFVDALTERVAQVICSENVQGLELSPPELVEWGDIDHFLFSFSDETFAEPSIDAYISALKTRNKLDSLTVEHLSYHRLIAFDAEDQEVGHWTVFQSLSGELDHHSQTYILSEGDFFEVKKGYMDELDEAVNKIDKFTGNLPPSQPSWSEDRYNRAVAALPGNFLLDKKTVKLDSRTTPIEICDILSSGKDLIHVKRKLNSSSLSHLFAQGIVSADLLLMSTEFRQKVRQRISGLEKERKTGNRFSQLLPSSRGITASAFTVVYGIIADWKGQTLAERLPFFSKVNLRRCVHDLTRMGYSVACKCIPNR